MKLEQYKLAYKDFEEWVNKTYAGLYGMRTNEIFKDFKLPFEMQSGVYLKYLDEKGIYIECELAKDWEAFLHTKVIVSEVITAKDRMEVLKLIIPEAFRLRNEQLKQKDK